MQCSPDSMGWRVPELALSVLILREQTFTGRLSFYLLHYQYSARPGINVIHPGD